MTNAALARMDRIMLPKFKKTGQADAALFWPYGEGRSIACTIEIDRNVQYEDTEAGALSHGTIITAYRAEIGAGDPDLKSYFTVGEETWIVDQIAEASDESRCVMIVTPKPC